MEKQINTPEVSVIMGTFNSSKTLNKSVDSILNQTFKNIEFIICDDSSSDSTYEMLKIYSTKDPRIKVIKNDKNLGLAMSLNRCLDLVTSKYVARMDDDDISVSDRLERQFEFMESNEDISICGTSRFLFDDDGVWGIDIQKGLRTKEQVFKGVTFVHPSVMMRKEDLKSIGNYNSEITLGRSEDYNLWCKFYFYGYVGYILDLPLIYYYEDKSSYTKRKYKFRIIDSSVRYFWYKKYKLPFKYLLNVIRPLIIGLVPTKIMIKIKKNKYKI